MSPELYPCWFCERPVDQDYLIAGYDTFDEARLACLDCDRTIHALRDKGWLRAAPPEPVGGREPVRESVVAAAVEWVEAHDALALGNPTGPPDSELLERYSEACTELLAVVSQNRSLLQASPPTVVSDGVALDDQCPERCLGVVGHPGPHQTSDYEPDTLGAAWAAAEAALPAGWGIGIEPSARGYEAGAGRNQWAVWSGMAHPSPAAALRALAQRLAREQADSEPQP